MQLLIYAAPFNSTGRNLQERILAMAPDAQSTFCTSLKALERYLRKPTGASPIGILIPSDDGDLAALIGMRHLLSDMRLILILPRHYTLEIPQISAHMLRPRFVSYADGDPSDVTAVLCRLNGHGCVNSPIRQLV